MKNLKISASVIVLFLMLAPLVTLAQGGQNGQKGIHEPGTGIENPELKETNRGTGQGLTAQATTSNQNQGNQGGQRMMNGTSTGNQMQNQAQGRGQNQASDNATRRRSQVATAVQEILRVADRNQGIGQRVRVIAQSRNQNQEQLEAGLEQVKNRGKLRKFFFGPDYKNLNTVEDRLANHTARLAELKAIAEQVSNAADSETLQEQIAVMEQVGAELENEVANETKGFSLFGWLNKMFANNWK